MTSPCAVTMSRHSAIRQLRPFSLPGVCPLARSTACPKDIRQQQQCRLASTKKSSSSSSSSSSNKQKSAKPQKKKKAPPQFKIRDLKEAEQFSLCDAMRYIRAFEVGRDSTSSKYEVAVRMRTLRSGAVIRSRLRLPHPVDTSTRIAVICAPKSKAGIAAKEAGAALVGEESILDAVKDGNIEFDRCICHPDSLPKLQAANLGRILGPRGLMPSVKTDTVIKDVAGAVNALFGGSQYKEKIGVVRMPIGQLGFTPDMMQANIRAFMANVRGESKRTKDDNVKEVAEVVLSSTNAPGFSLNGSFKSPESVPASALSTS